MKDVLGRPLNPCPMIAAQLRMARQAKSRKVAAGHMEQAVRIFVSTISPLNQAEAIRCVRELERLGVNLRDLNFALDTVGKRVAAEMADYRASLLAGAAG